MTRWLALAALLAGCGDMSTLSTLPGCTGVTLGDVELWTYFYTPAGSFLELGDEYGVIEPGASTCVHIRRDAICIHWGDNANAYEASFVLADPPNDWEVCTRWE